MSPLMIWLSVIFQTKHFLFFAATIHSLGKSLEDITESRKKLLAMTVYFLLF
jgi:hypothetical protein